MYRDDSRDPAHDRPCVRRVAAMLLPWLLAVPCFAHAAFLHGEALDTMADWLTIIVICVVPIVVIVIFWLVHILPEKIAHKKKHPQTRSIQCLCLLSLVFGGLLWPFAWLWAYSKPVIHKLAYGTDVDETLAHDHPEKSDAAEIEQLRARLAELEGKSKGGIS